MNRTTLIAAAFAVLVATTGLAAAVPGNAPASPADGADANAHEHGNANETNGAANANDAADSANANTSAHGTERAENGQGPPVDLPDQVPDHVSAIHDRISSFLSGDLETPLGDVISDVTPGNDDDDAAADDGDGESDETDDADEDADESDADTTETETDADAESTDGTDDESADNETDA